MRATVARHGNNEIGEEGDTLLEEEVRFQSTQEARTSRRCNVRTENSWRSSREADGGTEACVQSNRQGNETRCHKEKYCRKKEIKTGEAFRVG